MRMMLVLCACGVLASCATARSGCLPMKVYTAEEQKALAAEVGGLPASSPLVRAMQDYGALRAANRACKG